LQERGREHVRAHQQWAAQQWQQHANMFSQASTQLVAPPQPQFIVYQQPATTTFVETKQYQQRQVQYAPTTVTTTNYVHPFI